MTNFNTRLDLSRQSRIDLNEQASWAGSVAVGQNFYINGIQINVNNSYQGYVLAYDSLSNSYLSTPNSYFSITGDRILYGLDVTAINNLEYSVSPGVYVIDNLFYTFTGSSFSIFSGNSLYNRFDLISLNSGDSITNTVTINQGIPALNPQIPGIPESSVLLTILDVSAGATATGGSITLIPPNVIPSSNVTFYSGVYTNVNDYLIGNYQYPLITNFQNNIGDVQIGTVVSAITFSWTTNKTGQYFNLSGNSFSSNTFTKTFTGLNITGNTSFVLSFNDGINTTYATTSINFYNSLYYGLFTGTTINNSQIINLPYSKLDIDNKLSTIFITGSTGQYMYYCYPSRFNTPNLFVNGSYFTDITTSATTVTNINNYSENYSVNYITNPVYSTNLGFELK